MIPKTSALRSGPPSILCSAATAVSRAASFVAQPTPRSRLDQGLPAPTSVAPARRCPRAGQRAGSSRAAASDQQWDLRLDRLRRGHIVGELVVLAGERDRPAVEHLEITVKVLRVDDETQKIALGLKQLGTNPWSTVQATYEVGQVRTGRVTRLTEFGAFVELEPGVEGLAHASTFAPTGHSKGWSQSVAVGLTAGFEVLSIESRAEADRGRARRGRFGAGRRSGAAATGAPARRASHRQGSGPGRARGRGSARGHRAHGRRVAGGVRIDRRQASSRTQAAREVM